MAAASLPTPTEPSSRQPLRSYREAASHLARCHGRSLPVRPVVERKPTAPSSPPGSPSRLQGPAPSRCRSRTPSPPKPPASAPSEAGKSKAPRSVSPGGTPASSAGAASRQQQPEPQRRQPPLDLRAGKAVRWAPALVSSVRSRPRTAREDVPDLFYSRADERRFRREAELARDAVQDEWMEQLEDDSLASLSDDEDDARGSSQHRPLSSPNRGRKDYAISKAVVVFGGSARTYGVGAGGCAVEAAQASSSPEAFSFDDAAFWNGQLTWS